MEHTRNIKSEFEGGIVSAVFQMTDGLASDAYGFGEFLLRDVLLCAVLADLCFKCHSPLPAVPGVRA